MAFKKGQSGNPAGRKPGTTSGAKVHQKSGCQKSDNPLHTRTGDSPLMADFLAIFHRNQQQQRLNSKNQPNYSTLSILCYNITLLN
jgi:hypothetical protein